MKVKNTGIEGCLVIEPEVFSDSRGFFLESYQLDRYRALGIKQNFVQDNHSQSCLGVIRGLHFQWTKPQGKLVRVVRGEVYDVAVDIRQNSPTFGRWFGINLSATNKCQLWLPPGLAHGFAVTSDVADLEYKCTDYYDSADEGCLIWNDRQIGIDWPVDSPLLSEKDRQGIGFQELFN